MKKAVFLRALEPNAEDKGRHLTTTIRRVRQGEGTDEPSADSSVFDRAPESFRSIPGAPFAYWVSDTIREIFERFPPLEGNAGTVKVGLQTSDDFRFLRAWWEVDPAKIGYSQEDSERGRGWIHFAKGGSYSPYYADVHLVVNWFDRGSEIRNFERAYIRNEDFYFRPGLTWPRRTDGLSFRVLPVGSAFADKGPAVFVDDDEESELLSLLGILNSPLVETLVRAQLARTELAQSYEVGLIGQTPIPATGHDAFEVSVRKAFHLQRGRYLASETTHAFRGPVLSSTEGEPISLTEGVSRHVGEVTRRRDQLKSVSREIAEAVFDTYELPGGERAAIVETIPAFVESGRDLAVEKEQATRVAELLMWCIGVAFGRWDIRMAKDQSLVPDLPEPFAALPRVAPGGLVSPDALPPGARGIASEALLRARSDVNAMPGESFDGPAAIDADDYPFEVAWDGILVDDPDHPRDIVRKAREVLRFLYGDRAHDLEEEAVKILRAEGRTPATLRDWFRNQTATELGRNFFDFHIRRYSKSRRKAPIYWRLCSSPGRGQSSYGVWFYYHRLGGDTLWKVIDEYVAPRRELEERRLGELRAERADAEGADARQIEARIEESSDLVEELTWFETELRKAGDRGWAPDLDDGVVVNLAPLHSVVPWKEPEKIWKRLEAGEYDWAHLAMRYWPERVEEKCRSDRSLAIAHGVEDLFEGE